MKNWTERRQHIREAIRWEATAVMDNGVVRLDVMVLNLSRSGAMVQIPKTAALTTTFTLLFQHSIEPCRLVWNRTQFAGLQFLNPLAD